jgi:S1-C subfamily serine protease
LYAQNKIPEAIAYYRKAIELDPKDPIPRNNLEELQRELALQQNPQYATQQQGQQQTVIVSVPGNYRIVTGLPEKPLPLPYASVVKVVAKNPGINFGTGWVLKREENRVWILTNYHVLIDTSKQPYKEISVEFYSPSRIPPRFPAKILQPTKKNDSLDIAILEVMNVPNSTDIQALQMSSIDVSSNTVPVPARTIGHPNVSEVSDWTPNNGEISKITPQRLQLSNFTLYDGHSGAPVLDRQNHVVGVVYGISTPDVERGKTGTSGYGFAYPIDLVKNQLRTWGYEF